jgi:ankyrin repeat protein
MLLVSRRHDRERRGHNLKYRGERPACSLHLASQEENEDVARLLLERGTDVAAQINDGSTPFHLASQEGHKDVARLLLEHDADVTARQTMGQLLWI